MKEIKDDPETLVDRLIGIYPRAVDPYPVPPIQGEAAREIMRLRDRLAAIKESAEIVIDACEPYSDSLAETNELREMLGLGPYLMR